MLAIEQMVFWTNWWMYVTVVNAEYALAMTRNAMALWGFDTIK